MKKKMRCKADGEVKYRSNLMVVRILTRHPTKQIAFSSPRQIPARPILIGKVGKVERSP